MSGNYLRISWPHRSSFPTGATTHCGVLYFAAL